MLSEPKKERKKKERKPQKSSAAKKIEKDVLAVKLEADKDIAIIIA